MSTRNGSRYQQSESFPGEEVKISLIMRSVRHKMRGVAQQTSLTAMQDSQSQTQVVTTSI